ncbi:MAG: N-acetylmuramoyl-L-alanine amidase family protein [Lachnotalea sp.]
MTKRRKINIHITPRKKRKNVKWMLLGSVMMLMIACLLLLLHWMLEPKIVQNAPDFTVDLLTVNEYSRPGNASDKINGIVIHYTANPGTTAIQNRSYFEGLKDSKTTKASSHFIIGLEGEIIQCIPTNEIAYASNDRNNNTISIECCHMDATGKFSDETYQSLVHMTAWLCGKFDLRPKDVIRHYDITGKLCPLYYVENEDKWEQFIADVKDYIDINGIK